jgi:hypothetical protein
VSSIRQLLAFDHAIAAVRMLEAREVPTASGRSAAAELAHLLDELAAHRAEAAAGAPLDLEWAGRTVRWVAEWLPEGELPLLARLGGILRAADA